MRRGAIAAACLLLLGGTSAIAAVRIDGDPGGRIDQYLSRFEQLQRMKRLLVEGDELAANASRLFHGSIAPPRRGRGVIMPG